MQVALFLLFILVITGFSIALNQSYHIDEARKFDLNTIHTLSEPSHSCPDGISLNRIGRRRGRLGFTERSTGMCLLLELVALQVGILNHLGHSLNALLINTNSH